MIQRRYPGITGRVAPPGRNARLPQGETDAWSVEQEQVETRNGVPLSKPYVRRTDDDRAAEVRGEIARVQADVRRR